MKNPVIVLAAAVTGAALVLLAPPATAASPSTPVAVNGAHYKIRLMAGIARIPTRNERAAGYVRDKFKTWDDANHDCQDARSEVLRQESKRRVTGSCTVKRGRWLSYYDHLTFTDASDLDIDHLVPLAEVWRSGARSWSSAKREAYANDLTDRHTLVAVSAHSNRSKSDRDPSQWLPEYQKCTYVKSWVEVKLRWGLSADPAEKNALIAVASRCTNNKLTVHKAKVRTVAAPHKHRHHRGGSGSHHACTRTSSGSCISGGQFCPQASYGQAGYDAHGNRYVCSGSRSHPHWE